jgi:hypothetical protein
MPLTGAMRAWALGQAVLVVDVALAAGVGLSQRQPGTTQAPLFVLAGALVFFVPLVLALALRTIRTRAAFWVASILPAIVWIPAIPAVFLRGGPALATPSGLGLAAVAIGGAVLVTVGGILAAIEAARAAPAVAVVTTDERIEEPITTGSDEAEPVATAPAPMEPSKVVAPAASAAPLASSEAEAPPEIATAMEPDQPPEPAEATDSPDEIEPASDAVLADPPASDRTADDELVAELARESLTASTGPGDAGADARDESERTADMPDA